VALSPSGTILAYTEYRGGFLGGYSVKLCQVKDGKLIEQTVNILESDGIMDGEPELYFSSNGDLLAVESSPRGIIFWSLADKKNIHHLRGGNGNLYIVGTNIGLDYSATIRCSWLFIFNPR
jgi:hypothetical protein